jgi:2-polyprenyl-3-methyl-5-hydroxy-6-metoxy-1,4-benzoquinol methylase
LRDPGTENALAEFDAYASGYRDLVDRSIRVTGESSTYFAAYKAAYIARKIAPAPGSKVLDYGCGIGLLSHELKKQLKEVRVDGFDVSADSIQQVDPDLMRNGKFTSDLNELGTKYDAVIVANVLHHVEPGRRVRAIAEAASRLRTGGMLIVFEHNPLNPLTRRAVADCPFDKGVTLLNVKESLTLLRVNKLRIHSRDYIVFFPRWLAALRTFEDSLAWFPLGAQYVIVGERRWT